MNKDTLVRRRFFTPLFTILVKAMGLLKVSFIIGSWNAAFSGVNAIVPLAGVFGGFAGATGVFLLSLTLKFLFFGSIPFKFLAYHIPGYLASLYWINRSAWFRVGLPLMCMILFVAHPVGGAAYVYSFYWFVPMALFAVNKKTIFLEALGSTFIAHAVGSVIWIYAMPMTPVVWLSLVPIVFFERVIFALSITAMHVLISARYQILNAITCSYKVIYKKIYA